MSASQVEGAVAVSPSRLSSLFEAFTPWVPGPAGWIPLTLRTWLAMLLALVTAFWLQVDSAHSAAVCVAILGVPNRGQALSKSLYRMGGTVLGAVVSVILVALFPQQRFFLLAGSGLWLALCVVVGTIERDFRAYGAVLSGYTVAIVGLASIDTPNDVFDNAVSRVVVIAIGVAAVAVLHDVMSAPDVWRRLDQGLESQRRRICEISEAAVRGDVVPDASECAEIASDILAMTSQISFARTEFEDGNRRMAGARSAVAALLEQLSAARAVSYALRTGAVTSDTVEAARRLYSEAVEKEPSAVQDALPAFAGPPELADIFLIERTHALVTQHRLALGGLQALRTGSAPCRDVRLARYHDLYSALFNAARTVIAFGLAAALCIGSGQPSTSLLLVNAAANCAISATNPDPGSYARGMMTGAVLAVLAGLPIEYLLLTQGSGLPLLALSLFPLVLVSSLLSLNPRTSSVGFILLVWSLILIAPENMQGFDLLSSLLTAIQLIGSAVVFFITLNFVLPVSPARRVQRIALSLGLEVERRLRPSGRRAGIIALDLGPGLLDAESPVLASRMADRLAQARRWLALRQPKASRKPVLSRLTVLSDLCGALSRARRHLRRAGAVPALAGFAAAADRGLAAMVDDGSTEDLREAGRALIEASLTLDEAERNVALRAVSGLYGAAVLLDGQRRMLRLTGVIGRR